MASHDDVAHNWAHKTGKACNGFNMYYEGDMIFSRGSHFPIASHGHTPDGKQCLFFTTQSYSVARAIPSFYSGSDCPIFHVDNANPRNKSDHKKNYTHMLFERTATLDRASRARSHKQRLLQYAESLREKANAYTRAFRLGFRQVTPSPNLDEELKALARKNALNAMKKKLARAKQQEAQDKRDKENLAQWIQGEDVRAPHTRKPYLRLKGNEAQTTWGIKVPLKRALALHRLAVACKKRCKEFIPSKRLLVGGWEINRINQEGTIIAGCHVLPMDVQLEAIKHRSY